MMHSVGYIYTIFWFLIFVVIGSESINSQSSSKSSLDSLLQECAFKALALPKTKIGIAYEGSVPSNLTGIGISALMLTRYSLQWRGYGYYKEFFIPSGVIVEPYVSKLVLVYQNLANWSTFYYPLPGYTYLTPVLGILPYDADDLYAKKVPELDILAYEEPIAIRFSYVQPSPEESSHKCVYFHSNNWVEFGNVTDGNVCITRTQGHFAIVTDEVIVAPSPSPTSDKFAPSPAPAPTADEDNHQKINSKTSTILLGFLIFAFFGMLFVSVNKFGLLQIRERLHDSAEIVDPLLGNREDPLPLEAPTRILPENDCV